MIFYSCSGNLQRERKDGSIENLIRNAISEIENRNIEQQIINSDAFWGTDSTKHTTLSELTLSPKLFFYFTSNTCTPCIDQSVEIIKDVFPNYKKNENIIFVSPDYPLRYSNNCYGKKLLKLENNNFGLSINDDNQPPYFIVVKNMKVKSIHVVNKMDFDRTREYLSLVSKMIP